MAAPTRAAGSTDTSLWTHYKAGERSYCGNDFPDGMRKNDRLAANVITPTTKAHDHDVPITPAEIVANGLMTQASSIAAASGGTKLRGGWYMESGSQRKKLGTCVTGAAML